MKTCHQRKHLYLLLISVALHVFLFCFVPFSLRAQPYNHHHPAFYSKQTIRSEWFTSARTDSAGSMGTYLKAWNLLEKEHALLPKSKDYPYTQWYPLGPSVNTNPVLSQLGQLCALWIDTSNFRTLYAGSNTGGIFKTTDGGENWKSLADTIMTTGVLSIVADPRNQNHMFIGTGHWGFGRSYGRGILESNNGGATWEQTSLHSDILPYNFIVKELWIHPSSPDTILALLNTDFNYKAYIFRSTDGAKSWQAVYSVDGAGLYSIKPDPLNQDIIYVTGNRLLKSMDAGVNWTDVSAGISLDSNYTISRVEIAKTKANPNLMLALVESYDTIGTIPSYRSKLFKSDDNGLNFREISYHLYPNAGYWKMELEISPSDTNVFYLGGVRLFKYKIEGDSARYLYCSKHEYHFDVRDLQIFSQQGKDILYMANDGGISKSENGAEEWQDMTRKGMNATQFHNITIGENSDMMFAGPQDANLSFYNFTTGEWTKNAKVSDAYEGLIDYKNPDNVYMVGVPPNFLQPHIFLLKSTDGGRFFKYITLPDSTETGRFDKPLAMDPVDPQTLYAGIRNVWKSTDGALTWAKISDFPATGEPKLIAVRVAPSDNKVIAAAFENATWNVPGTIKFMISLDGGRSWLNRTPEGYNNLNYAGIADVTFHPENPQKIWLSLNGEWASRRVYMTEDAGLTWQNFSDGLPNLPVNTVTFISGTDYDMLLAATDAGVYYRSQNMQAWTPFGEGLPLTIISDLKISYSRKKIIAGTYGRGLWETDLCMPVNQEELIINNTVEWTGKRKVLQNVIINPGGKLVISSTIEMGLDRSIHVMPGATLELNRGTLTNDCAGMWDGIRLYGSASYNDSTLPQGKIVITRGGCIEFADTAIKTVGVDANGKLLYGKGGGIIRAISARFLNNRQSIEMNATEGFNPSVFIQCQFITNAKLPDDAFMGDMVSLKGTTGIKFLSCQFENSLPVSGPAFHHRGIGIKSYNSSFTVEQQLSSPVNRDNESIETSFRQLNYGIFATASAPGYTTSITDAVFDKNLTGIYLGGLSLSNVNHNHFVISPVYVHDSIRPASSAMYIDRCSFFDISHNVIAGPLSPLVSNAKSAGIIIHRAGAMNHLVFDNKISKCNYALLAQNSNRSLNGFTGLRLLHNQFKDNDYDIAVTHNHDESNNGLALHQGYESATAETFAGNVFSQNSTQNDGNLHNAGEILYYHYSGKNDSLLTAPKKSNRIYTAISTLAPENDSIYMPDFLMADNNLLDGLYEKYRLLSDETLDIFLEKAKQGSSASLINKIEHCAPNEVRQLIPELMKLSPYLSDKLLMSLVKQQAIIPNTLIYEVLKSNSHFYRNPDLMKAIGLMSPPFMSYMRASLLEAEHQFSGLEMDEAQAEALCAARDYLYMKLAFQLRNTIQDQDQLIISHLIKDNKPESHYLAAFLLNSCMQFEEADEIFDQIPVTFEKTNPDEHALLKELSALNRQLNLALSQPQQLTAQQLQSLNKLKQSSETSIFADNLLSEYHLSTYKPPYIFPGTPEMLQPPFTLPVIISGAGFRIFPVPASDYVVIDYYSESKSHSLTLNINTLQGSNILKVALTPPYGQKIMDVSNLSPGTYIFSMSQDNYVTGNQKVIIAR